VWHDGIGFSLCAKRLDRGRFGPPVTVDGVVALTAAQISYLLEAIDWRNPQHPWQPKRAGQAQECPEVRQERTPQIVRL
jgi:transposase